MKRFSLATAALVLLALPCTAADAPRPSLDAVQHALIGTWQSLGDTRLTRELNADGTAADRYEGAPHDAITGHWLAFSGSAPPKEAQGRKLVADAFYVELDQQGDALVFAVVQIDSQSMQLLSLDRGNVLSFSRFK